MLHKTNINCHNPVLPDVMKTVFISYDRKCLEILQCYVMIIASCHDFMMTLCDSSVTLSCSDKKCCHGTCKCKHAFPCQWISMVMSVAYLCWSYKAGFIY